MFDLWFELPRLLRAGLGLLIIVICGLIWLMTGRVWIWGFVVGVVFLLFSGAGSNKGGYNF